MYEKLQENLDERIEEIMNKKVRSISNIVSDAVTYKIMKAMKKMLYGQTKGAEHESQLDSNNTTDSPLTESGETKILQGHTSGVDITYHKSNNSLTEMVNELNNIEQPNIKLHDSPHDDQFTESSQTVLE